MNSGKKFFILMLLLTFSLFVYAQSADNVIKDDSVAQDSGSKSDAEAKNVAGQKDAENAAAKTEAKNVAAQKDAEVVISDEISGDEKKKEEEAKPFSVGVTNVMSHNLAKERKRFSEGMSFSFGAMVPYEISLGLNVGFSSVFMYDRTDVDGNSANYSQFDGAPVAVNAARTFLLPLDFSISPAIELSSNITSKYARNATGNNLGISLSASVAKSFKINEDWKASLSLTPGYTADIHEKDFYYDHVTDDAQFYNPVHQLSVSAGASISWKTLSFKVGYSLMTAETYYDEDYEGMGVIDNDKWPLNFTYSMGLAYVLDLKELGGFNFGLNFATSGRDRAYGGYGDDYLVPFDPYYSTISLSIGYNYSF